MELESISMGIIAGAGDAKGLAFEALAEAKKGNFEKAHALLEQCDKANKEAHKAQMALLTAQASGEEVNVDVLLIHAQDHLMTTLLAQELITEMIDILERK